ncbi:hypothetical protein [uncultured Tateyamaria sp.]|uniref:hypothetical protein n=1 Tax=uncultured Tateyamaria sp. TaxID=455651 RepID=UPI00263652F9|nr:hypothetical protein [uncultured Tateyamaria sp.]
MRFGVLCAGMLLWASPGFSQWIGVEDVIKYETVNPMRIDIHDKAINGCWTNIGEVRTYLTDQLDIGGFEVIGRGVTLKSMVEVTVLGERLTNGVCSGVIIFDFRMPANVRGTDGFTEVSVTSHTSYVVGQNFNVQALEGAKRFAIEFLAKTAQAHDEEG